MIPLHLSSSLVCFPICRFLFPFLPPWPLVPAACFFFFLLCAISGGFCFVFFSLQAAATSLCHVFYRVSYKKKQKKQAVTFRFHVSGMCCCYREHFNSWKSPGFCVLVGTGERPRFVGQCPKYRQIWTINQNIPFRWSVCDALRDGELKSLHLQAHCFAEVIFQIIICSLNQHF